MDNENKLLLYIILLLITGVLMGKISEVDQAFYFLVAFLPGTFICILLMILSYNLVRNNK